MSAEYNLGSTPLCSLVAKERRNNLKLSTGNSGGGGQGGPKQQINIAEEQKKELLSMIAANFLLWPTQPKNQSPNW